MQAELSCGNFLNYTISVQDGKKLLHKGFLMCTNKKVSISNVSVRSTGTLIMTRSVLKAAVTHTSNSKYVIFLLIFHAIAVLSAIARDA
jgi:hypothetical protein